MTKKKEPFDHELKKKFEAANPGCTMNPIPDSFQHNKGTIIHSCTIDGGRMSDKQAEAISEIARASIQHAHALQKLAEAANYIGVKTGIHVGSPPS